MNPIAHTKKLNKRASRVLNTLTEGLEIGEGRKIDNTEGAFMAVSVNRLGESLYSVTHYYEQNGDLVPDPDMVFYRAEIPEELGGNRYHPVTFQNFMVYQEAVLFEDGKMSGFRPKLQQELVSFANGWMKNIKQQQSIRPQSSKAELTDEERKAVSK